MYKIKTLNVRFNNFSYFGNCINSIQFLKLSKHESYPQYNNFIKRNEITHILINSGKLVVNMEKINKKSKKRVSETLFLENELVYKIEDDHDLIINNQPYIFKINPNVFFNVYAYSTTSMQIFYKSDSTINSYTLFENKYQLNNINYLK